MPDSTDKNKPENEQAQSDDVTNASHDLSKDIEEAMRLHRESQENQSHKSAETSSSEVVVEDNGNTTNDLQQEAFKAMQIQVERKREAEEKARSAVEARSSFTTRCALN